MFNWPSFAITTGNFVATYIDGQEKKFAEGNGLYYGLSWDEKDIYILRRDGKVQPGFPEIAVYDSSLVEKDILPGPFIGGHQIHCDGKNLYVTLTSSNSIEVIDLEQKTSSIKNWTGVEEDANHINSIWKDKMGFWSCYHNNPKRTGRGSVVVLTDLDSIYRQIPLGRGNHNVVRIDNLLYVCSSDENKLIIYDLVIDKVVAEVQLGYWVRGVGVTDTKIILGATSIEDDRDKRLTGSSEVYLLDRFSLDVLDKMEIKGSGSIYELRVIGERDYAHNGIAFPGIM